MKKLSAYLFVFLAIAVKSNGQDRFVLEGTIGQTPVVMQVYDEWAYYFYKSKRKGIQLNKIRNANGRMVLVKKEEDNESGKEIILEKIEIQRTANRSLNEWKGYWVDKKGTQLKVYLKKIDTTKYAFQSIPDLDFSSNEEMIYSKARLYGLTFVVDSVTRTGKYEIEWRHEPVSKVQSIRLKSGFPPSLLGKINAVLKKKEFSNLNEYFECYALSRVDKDLEYDSWINGYFISEDYLSVQARLNAYCGGAYPSAGDASFTIDIKTGKEITAITELFPFSGETIVSILTKLYPAEMKKPASEEDCDYSEPHNWEYPEWYFTAQGLYVGTSFPHARYGCNGPEFSIIPYEVLKQYSKKNK
ncbi:MAG: hypothetical protein V4557_14140 [Bacteroidota bacterium]